MQNDKYYHKYMKYKNKYLKMKNRMNGGNGLILKSNVFGNMGVIPFKYYGPNCNWRRREDGHTNNHLPPLQIENVSNTTVSFALSVHHIKKIKENNEIKQTVDLLLTCWDIPPTTRILLNEKLKDYTIGLNNVYNLAKMSSYKAPCFDDNNITSTVVFKLYALSDKLQLESRTPYNIFIEEVNKKQIGQSTLIGKVVDNTRLISS